MCISTLSASWQAIAEECKALPRDTALDVSVMRNRESVVNTMINGKPRWLSGWDGVRKWWNWGISIGGQFPLGDAHLPVTCSLLKNIEGLQFAGLSLFRGGAIIPVHSHPENKNLLTFHLGLDVPEHCWLNVGGEFIREQNGYGFSFDGTKPHYAFNANNADRLILHAEIRTGAASVGRERPPSVERKPPPNHKG